jgi:hypothetical protein
MFILFVLICQAKDHPYRRQVYVCMYSNQSQSINKITSCIFTTHNTRSMLQLMYSNYKYQVFKMTDPETTVRFHSSVTILQG